MTETNDPKQLAEHAANTLLSRFDITAIDIALVLGSGWSGASLGLGETIGEIELAELPGFAKPVVAGHGGTLRLARTSTRAAPEPVVRFQQRVLSGRPKGIVDLPEVGVLAWSVAVALFDVLLGTV